MTKPDRRVTNVYEWIRERPAMVKAVSSHWAFAPQEYLKGPGDIYVGFHRNMADVVFSLWDYLQGLDWFIRLGKRRAMENAAEVFHWSWWPMVMGMIDCHYAGWESWLDRQRSIPDLVTNTTDNQFDVTISASNIELGLARLSDVTGHDFKLIDGRINATKEVEWRDQYRRKVEGLIVYR